MWMLGEQKVDVLTLAAFLSFIVAAVVLGVLGGVLPWALLALTGLALLAYWALKWDVTVWAWLWVLSYGILDWPEWREQMEIGGVFTLSVPRIVFLMILAVFALHFLLHRQRLRFDRAVLWVMLLLVVVCGLSATAAGWTATTYKYEAHPYYKFLVPLLSPFVLFLLLYSTTRTERHIRWVVLLIALYGWYSLYVSYLQYAALSGWWGGARAFLWPPYINNPEYGIHFDRARGAFGSAIPQAIFLTLLFYLDLYVLRTFRGWVRLPAAVQALLCVPALFFTGLRAGYMAFVLCGIIWCLWGSRRFGKLRMAAAGMLLLVAVAVFWENFTRTDRLTGGVAQKGPIYARFTLIEQSWEMFKQRPLFGVGFGHFLDVQQTMARDPQSLAGLSVGALSGHNLFGNMAAETGLAGLLPTIVIFWLLYRQSRQLYLKLPETAAGLLSRPFVVLFWAAMVNYLVNALFADPLWEMGTSALFWALAGLMMGYNRLLEPPPADVSPEHPVPNG